MPGNNPVGNIFTEVIIIKKCLPRQKPRQLPTAEVNFEGWTISNISDMSRHKNVKTQFIPGMSGNWVNIYIWGILVLAFMESWIPVFFKLFLLGLYIPQVTFSVNFCWSVNCISWVLMNYSTKFGLLQKLKYHLYLRLFSFVCIYSKKKFHYK